MVSVLIYGTVMRIQNALQNLFSARNWHYAVTAFVLTWAVPTFAQVAPKCLRADSQQCLLKVDQTGFRAQIDERGRIVIVFGNNPSEFQTGESYVVVQDDLERLEEDEAYSPNETAQLKNELATFDGAVYAVPSVEDLRLALGFPETSMIGARDYYDLIQVHLQLVLSVSALTAGYLSDLIGLNLVSETPAAPAPTAPPVQDTITTNRN